jgi:iron-sulfur cluster repair protein YtfE (RIC family)
MRSARQPRGIVRRGGISAWRSQAAFLHGRVAWSLTMGVNQVPDATHAESLAVIEMKLIHDIHRAAAALLTEVAERAGPPPAELAELRAFVVAALRHHHESEDVTLWPMLEAAGHGSAGLTELTGEHHRLDAALDTLAASAAEGAGLAAAAASVRELVGAHMAHEESLTFPALRALTDAQWADFSRAAMESFPLAVAYLQIGLMEEVGDPAEVARVLAGLPAPAAQALPAMRERARATLGALRSGSGTAS